MKRPITLLRRASLPLILAIPSMLLLVATAAKSQTNSIENTASASFTDSEGNAGFISDSNTVVISGVSQTELQLVKTADRAAAEPGDTVVFRLLLTNSGSSAASNITFTDTLPLGFVFVPNSLQASITANGSTTTLTTGEAGSGAQVTYSLSGNTLTFNVSESLPAGGSLTIAYAVNITSDAVRGSGRNHVVATAGATGAVSSNGASAVISIRPGILNDCGTLIGRVFVDKNFDGEQQPGEPGVPNAVIFLDDGNRITTDADGLFSLAFILPGYRTGTLDLTSLPGYTLAPNIRRIEGNSRSRMVRVSPGSLVKMNFGVTPAFGQEEEERS